MVLPYAPTQDRPPARSGRWVALWLACVAVGCLLFVLGFGIGYHRGYRRAEADVAPQLRAMHRLIRGAGD